MPLLSNLAMSTSVKTFCQITKIKENYNKMIGIDLFAGAGGMSLGAKMAGVDTQIVIEADLHAARTYLLNHQPKHGLFQEDIRKFNKVDIDKGKPTVLFGGPPCQGFSTSNQKTRTAENENNWLFQEFLRVTKMYNPDWVVFENVKGILETEKGIFVDEIICALQKLGYTTSSKVLNATDFNVPQKRARFFIVGSRHNVNFEFPSPSSAKSITVKQAISDLPVIKNGASECYKKYRTARRSNYSKLLRNGDLGCNNNLVTRNSELILKRYKHIPQGGNWEFIPVRLMKNYTDSSRCHTGIYHRLCENKPSVVIGNYRKNMLIHPSQDRGLSVREAARIQSFPDWFTFTGSIGFQQQQVGNAVPPLLAKAIFDKLLEY